MNIFSNDADDPICYNEDKTMGYRASELLNFLSSPRWDKVMLHTIGINIVPEWHATWKIEPLNPWDDDGGLDFD